MAEESPPTCNVFKLEVPKYAGKESLTKLLQEEIDRITDIIERSDYLIINIQRFHQSPDSE